MGKYSWTGWAVGVAMAMAFAPVIGITGVIAGFAWGFGMSMAGIVVGSIIDEKVGN